MITKPDIRKFDSNSEFYFHEGCFIAEMSNTPDDPEMSIARARVGPGQKTKWHYLNGVTERYVILEGTGSVEVGNLAPQEVTAGDVVLIPPGTPQRIANMGGNDLVFLAICVPRFDNSVYVSVLS
ncbi:MAG: cupin domain-containing protein [Gammaproteobacteria bacterium]|nr:cupin domain-containing protein [Gammaproteobacteria bacterium]